MPPRTRNVMKDDFGRKLPSGRSPASAFTPRTRFYPQTGFTVRGHDVASARTREKKNIIIFYFLFFYFFLIFFKFFYFLVVVASFEREKKIRFSVFNPQTPQTPQTPRAPRASQAKPREEEGFFGLIPLVTHPSSIPLLGCLTPKFLSLSLHSL
jgi:hypothetical protein